MIIETLLGTVFGGAARLGQEFMSLKDKKDERAHELAMFDKQIEADKLKSSQQIALVEANLGPAEINALIEATKAQAMKTGIAWVDAISSLMRPTITFWWVIVLYTLALYAEFSVLVVSGESYINAILNLWGPDEKAIVASIISFWFVDRSLRKK